MGRTIGIRHRVKKTADGESRPTQVALLQGGKTRLLELPDEQAELDFVLGQFPVAYHKVRPGEDITEILASHGSYVTFKKVDVVPEERHPSQVKRDGRLVFCATQVPSEFDGLSEGDTVAMILGGSGDYLAFALTRRAETLGARVLRIPSFTLKQRRGEGDKEEDASFVAHLVQEAPELFYPVTDRDLALVTVRETFRARTDAMKDRIACIQRLRQRHIGAIFCSPDGMFPEGGVEKAFDDRKANDVIYQALLAEEAARVRELTSAIEGLDVYQRVFSPVEGCGPMIASRIISAVIDIRRFATEPAFKKFCGVHTLPDGSFARRRQGQVANWHPDCRQALYLIGDQFNRRPNSPWGQKLREYKVKLRAAHPEVVVTEGGKKRYTDGHIHKMALWRTITKFAEYIYMEWMRLERETARLKRAA